MFVFLQLFVPYESALVLLLVNSSKLQGGLVDK